MLKKYLLLLLSLTLHAWASIDEQILVQHVLQSLSKAKARQSNLPPELFTIPGMTSYPIKHFLNNLCSLPSTSYLEIGCWQGSTLCSALYGNDAAITQAIAIDNFSEFGGPKAEFLANVKLYLPHSTLQFYECNSFVMSKEPFVRPVNIYFYDGAHDAESQEKAFTYFNDVFDDVFVVIVDDWNEPDAKKGTKLAFQTLNYQILFEESLPTNCNGDPESWWNGLYVAVVKKPPTVN